MLIFLSETLFFPAAFAALLGLLMSHWLKNDHRFNYLIVIFAFALGYFLVFDAFSFSLRQALDGVAYGLLLAAVVAGIHPRTWLTLMAPIGWLLLLFWPLLTPSMDQALLINLLLWAVLWVSIHIYLVSLSEPIVLITLNAVAVTAAIIISLAGSVLIGQLVGVLASVLAVMIILAYWFSVHYSRAAVTSCVSLILGGLLITAYYFVEVDTVSLCLCLAILLLVPIIVTMLKYPAKYPKTLCYVLFIMGYLMLTASAIYRVYPQPSLY